MPTYTIIVEARSQLATTVEAGDLREAVETALTRNLSSGYDGDPCSEWVVVTPCIDEVCESKLVDVGVPAGTERNVRRAIVATRNCTTCIKYFSPRWDCPDCGGTGVTIVDTARQIWTGEK